MSEQTEGRLNPYRWATIFGTLSLDLCSPYLGDMHLQTPPRERFLVGLRAVIERFRGLQAANPSADLAFAESAFAWASQDFGPGFSDHLYLWGEKVFQCGNGIGASVFLWNNILRMQAGTGAATAGGTPELVLILRYELANQPMVKVDRVPKTIWDKNLYARNGYDELMNPMEFVESTINFCRLISAWHMAVLRVGKVNLNDIRSWGAEQAMHLGMPVERLGSPGDWPDFPAPWMS